MENKESPKPKKKKKDRKKAHAHTALLSAFIEAFDEGGDTDVAVRAGEEDDDGLTAGIESCNRFAETGKRKREDKEKNFE